jgi:hypothetical protein
MSFMEYDATRRSMALAQEPGEGGEAGNTKRRQIKVMSIAMTAGRVSPLEELMDLNMIFSDVLSYGFGNVYFSQLCMLSFAKFSTACIYNIHITMF